MFSFLSIFNRSRSSALAAPWRPPAAEEPDATRRLDEILHAAAIDEASDVHFEPKEDGLLVRFRIDGILHKHLKLPVAQREQLIARAKIFGGMDITERRLPQDGRASITEGGKKIQLRLSSLSTVHGEKIAVRLLDQTMPARDFAALGFTLAQADLLNAALSGPPGLILLTGPTGSGKTTTLHAALHALDTPGRAIHTLEDPVEYEFAAICQTEIREKIGLTFAAGLRALTRQDPNVMLVGETRDAETAQLAISAALRGHLVLSTLHSNDALSAITRLRDLGIEPYLIAAAVRLFAAQRLARKLCAECKAPHRDTLRLGDRFQVADAQFFQPVGCPACKGRGYRGRLPIHEVIPAEKFQPLIAAGAPMADLAALRAAEGHRTLWQHGLGLAAAGLTSPEEVLRIL